MSWKSAYVLLATDTFVQYQEVSGHGEIDILKFIERFIAH